MIEVNAEKPQNEGKVKGRDHSKKDGDNNRGLVYDMKVISRR